MKNYPGSSVSSQEKQFGNIFWQKVYTEVRSKFEQHGDVGHIETWLQEHSECPMRGGMRTIRGIVKFPNIPTCSIADFREWYRNAPTFDRAFVLFLIRKIHGEKKSPTMRFVHGRFRKSGLRTFSPVLWLLVSQPIQIIDRILTEPKFDAHFDHFYALFRDHKAPERPHAIDQIVSIFSELHDEMNISVYKPVVNFASVCTEFKEKVADLFVKRVTTLTHDDQDYERKNCLHDKIRERVLTIAEESLQFSCKAQEARVAGEKRVMQHSIERYGAPGVDPKKLITSTLNEIVRHCSENLIKEPLIGETLEEYDRGYTQKEKLRSRFPASIGSKLHFDVPGHAEAFVHASGKVKRTNYFSLLDRTCVTLPVSRSYPELVIFLSELNQEVGADLWNFQYQFTYPGRLIADFCALGRSAVLFTTPKEFNTPYEESSFATNQENLTGRKPVIYDNGVVDRTKQTLPESIGRTDIVGCYSYENAEVFSIVHRLLLYVQHRPNSAIGQLGHRFIDAYLDILKTYGFSDIFDYSWVKMMPELEREYSACRIQTGKKSNSCLPVVNRCIEASVENQTNYTSGKPTGVYFDTRSLLFTYKKMLESCGGYDLVDNLELCKNEQKF